MGPRMTKAFTSIGLGIVILALFAWYFRYDIEPSYNSLSFYKYDRWTGRSYLCAADGCERTDIDKPLGSSGGSKD